MYSCCDHDSPSHHIPHEISTYGDGKTSTRSIDIVARHMFADLYFLSSMSCALMNHWVRLHSIDMDLFDQADGFNGAHIVSIVMCVGKVETAPKFAGRVTRVK